MVVPDYYARYPEALRRRLGAARDQRLAVRQGHALPRGGNDSRASNSGTCATGRSPRSGATIPAFNAFRGTDWMREPCRSCDRREIDWGGCRCQAMALAGDAAATDPACSKSPLHARIEAMAAAEAEAAPRTIRWRSYKETIEGLSLGPSTSVRPIDGRRRV